MSGKTSCNYFLLLASLALLFTLGGCSQNCSICSLKPCLPKLCCGGSPRRPPVFMTYSDWVWDYNFDDSCCERSPCESSCDSTQCQGDKNSFSALQKNKEEPLQYRVSAGDTLEISIYGDEDTLVEEVEVAPDGRLYYTFLDGMMVEGMTLEELKKEVELRLTHLFIHPVVSILPKQISSQKYVVLGRVKNPGVYPLATGVTLRQAIGQAGGLLLEPDILHETIGGGYYIRPARNGRRSISNLQDSFLVRHGQRIPVDFESLMRNPGNQQDIPLQAGDYIYIAGTDTREVFVLGNGKAATLPYREGMTLMGAIASTGGWGAPNPYSPDLRKVAVIRGSLNCPYATEADVRLILEGKARDVYLCPGDIVFMHNKCFRFGRELVKLAVETFVNSFVTGAASVWVPDD